MKKLFVFLCLLPLASFSQTLNVIMADIDSLRSYVPMISSVLGVTLKENVRPDKTYPASFGNKESGTYIQASFMNRDLTDGLELVADVAIYGRKEKIDSLYNYFKSLAKTRPSFRDGSDVFTWDNTTVLTFELANNMKGLRLKNRISPKKK